MSTRWLIAKDGMTDDSNSDKHQGMYLLQRVRKDNLLWLRGRRGHEMSSVRRVRATSLPIRRNALRLLRPTWALPPILDMPRRVTPDGEGQVKGSEFFCVA